CRQLVGSGGAAGGLPPAPILAAHPEIDWRGWVGLRNVLTHGYHRRDPQVIWRATGELTALVQACEAWATTGRTPDA
ncbi:MAG: HepT-like ribonuclease domain-containing protein, partial [Geminicoccaceae bacterium]